MKSYEGMGDSRPGDVKPLSPSGRGDQGTQLLESRIDAGRDYLQARPAAVRCGSVIARSGSEGGDSGVLAQLVGAGET